MEKPQKMSAHEKMDSKRVQWVEILNHPVIAESIAYSLEVGSFRILSTSCKSLFDDGKYLDVMVRAHRDAKLYSSLDYQRLVQLAPFQQRPVYLDWFSSFGCNGQQSVRVMNC